MICDICGKNIVAANKNAELIDGKKCHKDCMLQLKSSIKAVATKNVKKYQKLDKAQADKLNIEEILKENKQGDWREK